jgi:CheY-like chemotaxis protein
MRSCIFVTALFLLANPFAAVLPSERAAAQSAPETDPDGSTRPDELIRQLESNAARGGELRFNAIRSLAQLKAWEKVDRWLSTLNDETDASQLARAAELIGPEWLLRISLQEEINEASRQAIEKINDAARQQRTAPAKLEAAIEGLSSRESDQVLAASRTLLQAGNAAIAELAGAIAKGIRGEQLQRALGVLAELGPGGQQALEQLALYGTDRTRAEALRGLAALDREGSIDSLLAAAHANAATANEVATGTAYLASLGVRADRPEAIRYLSERLGELRKTAADTPNDHSPAMIWSVNDSRDGVEWIRSTEIFLRYRDAYDAAQRLNRFENLPAAVRRQILASDLGYRVMVDLDWGDEEQVSPFLAANRFARSIEFLLESLSETRERGQIPATIGILRLLDHITDNDSNTTAERSVLASSQDGNWSPLVNATQDAEPRIRYEAAALIAKYFSDQDVYAGSSLVRQTLAEMSRLGDQPLAILIETRPIYALKQEAILGQLGYEVRSVTSAMQAEREIAKGRDIRLVLSKIRLADMRPTELVDRIRRLARGKDLPIVFYLDVDTNPRAVESVKREATKGRWSDVSDASVYFVPLPGSPAALAEVRREMRTARRLPPLTVSERSTMRKIGREAMR